MNRLAKLFKEIVMNLELYATMIVAFGLCILNSLGYAPATWVPSVILAALGILTAAALRDRHKFNSAAEHLSLLNGETIRISDKINISSLSLDTGLLELRNQSREIDWDGLFEGVNEIDLFFTYARTWRNANQNLLYKFIERRDARLRVILPNPESNIILSELSNRFSKSAEEFKNLILDAKDEYSKMHHIGRQCNGATVEIWYASVTPMYALYRFDRTVILSLGSYKPFKGDVPHFIADRRGSFYRFVMGELNTLMNLDGRLISKQVL